MTCAQCGTAVADDSIACPRCGARFARPVAPAGTHPTAAATYNFDVSRWTRTDRIVIVASSITLISLFMPWFSVDLGAFGSASASGTDAHGWLWFVFVLVLALLTYMVVAAGYERFPVNLPLRHDRLLLSIAGFNLFLVFLGFVLKPGGSAVGWDFGAFFGLFAAIAAVLPFVLAGRLQQR